jgi:Tfp pilus assembly protein FimT
MSPRRIAKALALSGGVALGAILIVTIWVVRHRIPEQKLISAAGLLPNSLLHARNFHWTQMKGEKNQWVLAAKDASYSNDKTSVTLKEATVSMTTEDGKHVRLTAPTAVLTMDGNHEGQGLTVTGVGMTGHPKTETFELLKEVSTQIVPKAKGGDAKVS